MRRKSGVTGWKMTAVPALGRVLLTGRALFTGCALIAGCALLAGCGGGGGDGSGRKDNGGNSAAEFKTYRFEDSGAGMYVGSDGGEYILGSMIYRDNAIYYGTYNYSDDEPYEAIYKYDINSGEQECIYGNTPERGGIAAFNVLADGNIVCLVSYIHKDDGTGGISQELSIKTINPGGMETGEKSISGNFKNSTADFNNGLCVIDSDGNVIIASDRDLYVFTEEGSLKGEIAVNERIDSITADKNGDIAVCFDGSQGTGFVKADINEMKLGDRLENVSGVEGGGVYHMCSGGIYDICLWDDDSLYAYDEKSSSRTELMKWLDSGITGGVDSVLPLDDGRIFCVYYDGAAINVGFLVESDGAGDREVITVCEAYASWDNDIREKIIEFNNSSDKYRIDYKTYGDERDPVKKMATDILTGNAPDVIGTRGIDFNNFVYKGVFEDLTEYYANDSEVSEDSYVDGLADALRIDGKLYCMPKSYGLTYIAGRKSELEKYVDGWSVDDFISYYKSRPEGSMITITNDKPDVYGQIVLNCMNDYVNWKTGEVNFDNDEFRKLMEFANTFPDSDDSDYDIYKMAKEGRVCFIQSYFGGVGNMTLAEALYDGDVVYLGYPGAGEGSIYLNDVSYGICASSSNKEGAWEVVKMLAAPNKYDEENMLYNTVGRDSIPATREEFDEWAKGCIEYVVPEEEEKRGSIGIQDFFVERKAASEENIQTIKDLTKRAVRSNELSSEAVVLIQDTVMSYFNGEKSLDDAVRIIQDKMEKYVNENR